MRHAFRISSIKSQWFRVDLLSRSSKLPVQFGRESIRTHLTKHKPRSPLLDSKPHARSLKKIEKARRLDILIQEFEEENINTPRLISEIVMPRSRKTHSYIHFITTPTVDTPGTALLLHFDDKRYVIGNLHEGLQRAALQTGARFFKAKDFFLTGKTEWRTNGGLFGMILSLSDATNASAISKAQNAKEKLERRKAREEELQRNPPKKGKKAGHEPHKTPKEPQISEEDPRVTLHGGPNLTHTVATARGFIFRHGTPIKVHEHGNEEPMSGQEQEWRPTWEDERIKVWAIPVSPSDSDDLRPSSPRKRSLGEYMSGQNSTAADADDQWSTQPKGHADQERRNQQVREFVVSEMFDSSWRYDNLVETPLRDVVLPAGIYIRDPRTKKIIKYEGPSPDGTAPIPDINVLVRKPWPGAMVDHLPAAKSSHVAMSYIIRNQRQRGRFKPDVATALNVPAGDLWRTLSAGSEVQSSDGKTVTSDMVMEPSTIGNGIAVIELPSKEYVQNLVSRPEWDVEKIMNGIGGIVWILGPGVSEDNDLREFMKKKSELRHIISSPDHCPNHLVQNSAAAAAIRHNQVDPTHFPVPIHSNSMPSALNQLVDKATDGSQLAGPELTLAKRGLKIELQPSFGLSDKDIVPLLNTALTAQQTSGSVIRLAQSAQRALSHVPQSFNANQGLPSQDAEIICLGTGSASPSLYRNVSGTLLRVPGHGSYLLDCGEDTLGQLKRVFPEPEVREILRDLKLIWISHLHADHHLGTISVIRAWYEEVHGRDPSRQDRATLTEQLLNPSKFLSEGRRLFVVGHGLLLRYLEEYSSVEDFGFHQLVPVASYPASWRQPDLCDLQWNGLNIGFNTSKDSKLRSAIRKATSLSNLVSAPVRHCYGAQAVSLTFPNGFKFSYSGDCRPSKEFAVIGKGSTVLLHEATFDDELIGDAKAKRHSTTGEAIGVGLAMGAKRLLLTHFSQRYQKIPSIRSLMNMDVKLEETKEAEDGMEGIDGLEPPENIEDQSPTKTTDILTGQPPEALDQDYKQVEKDKDSVSKSLSPTADPAVTTLGAMANLVRPSAPSMNYMKIGVAFDYMRIKVGDIIHLEKFTPALRELYKEAEKEELEGKAKKAAEEVPVDDEKNVILAETGESAEAREPQEAGKGQLVKSKRQEKREKKKLSKENLKAELAAGNVDSVSRASGAVERNGTSLRPSDTVETPHDQENPSDEYSKLDENPIVPTPAGTVEPPPNQENPSDEPSKLQETSTDPRTDEGQRPSTTTSA